MHSQPTIPVGGGVGAFPLGGAGGGSGLYLSSGGGGLLCFLLTIYSSVTHAADLSIKFFIWAEYQITNNTGYYRWQTEQQ